MKFIVTILLIALSSFAACLYLPWWSIAIAAFLVSFLIPIKPGLAFLAGFISVFLLWGTISFVLSYNNQHILAQKLSLLILKSNNSILLILLTAILGAVVAGFAALCGRLSRTLFN